jgi:hypothetical protein
VAKPPSPATPLVHADSPAVQKDPGVVASAKYDTIRRRTATNPTIDHDTEASL